MYICMYVRMHYLLKTCPPSQFHNSFMATVARGHTHVRLYVAGIENPNQAQVNTRLKRIIIDTNIYMHIYIR